MGKSITKKIAVEQKKSAAVEEKEAPKQIDKLSSSAKLQQLQKVKTTNQSISKKHREKDAKAQEQQRLKDLDELKQLLHLEPPKLDVGAFDSMLNLAGKEQAVKKSKKLSKNQKNFRKYLKEMDDLRALEQNPKNIVDRHTDQIKAQIDKTLSRGQRKRLGKKISAFATKEHLSDKSKNMKVELAKERRDKMVKMEGERRAQEKLNQAFMVDEDSGKKSSVLGGRGNAANKNSLDMFGSMDQVLNQIKNQQNAQKNGNNRMNDSMSSGKKQQKLSKGESKRIKQQEEMERLKKISSLQSFSNQEFALDTLFQHVQNTVHTKN